MNELSVSDQEKILGLLRLGWSERRIAHETGHHRKTIKRLKDALQAEPSQIQETHVVSEGEAAKETQTSRSSCELHRVFIEDAIIQGRNAMAIYQDLVEHHGYCGA